MIKIVGVRFKDAGKIYYFSPGDLDIAEDQGVIVENAQGIEFGRAVIEPRFVDEEDVVLPLKNVVRIATKADYKCVAENRESCSEALSLCAEKIMEHKIDMNLVDVDYTFDRNKIIFYFTAEGRVDFRELVKDLASVFRTRIELRQIGVRDEAKLLGGIGPCGRMLCCSTFLGDFEPVSIKMAKDQNLSLNPTKISGLCGRLMCCLKYENDEYEVAKREMPDVGTVITTPEGTEAKVTGINLLQRLLQVRMPEEETILEYTLDEIRPFNSFLAKS
ncbi:stage 0 sporulation family protein [Listeria sp. ILCC797]|uniref:PSP1 domain-containing protein n=1 Tax=Listeria sp. ILCC797 TaxID=1918333 RepID=UPI000B58EDD3|nr:stage 0 sporulation family protein [Listeria sp. ILCC797]